MAHMCIFVTVIGNTLDLYQCTQKNSKLGFKFYGINSSEIMNHISSQNCISNCLSVCVKRVVWKVKRTGVLIINIYISRKSCTLSLWNHFLPQGYIHSFPCGCKRVKNVKFDEYKIWNVKTGHVWSACWAEMRDT